jgi:2-methylisocitrate lyase-like PEP mutase family enzyme
MPDTAQERKARAFQALHEGEPFIIPNPWDAGSARLLQTLGYQALATTSSGFAFTLGRRDGGATLDELARHVRAVCEATDLPVSVDLENGHGRRLEDAAAAIERAAEAGAVGGSIEDWDPQEGLYELERAAERVAVACQAASRLGFPFMVTGRAENHIRGNPDLEDTIERLRAYERAGAHVLYAPGLRTVEEIRAVCSAISRPVNVLALRGGPRFAEIVEAGAQRVSVGGGLAAAAIEAVARVAEQMRDSGDFAGLGSGRRFAEWLGG